MAKAKTKAKDKAAVDKAAVDSTSHAAQVEIEGQSHYYSRVAKLPPSARYLLVVFGSLFLSSSLLTVFSSQTAGQLAGVSRHLEEWWGIGGLILWRATELGLAWILGFDGEHKLVLSVLLLSEERPGS